MRSLSRTRRLIFSTLSQGSSKLGKAIVDSDDQEASHAQNEHYTYNTKSDRQLRLDHKKTSLQRRIRYQLTSMPGTCDRSTSRRMTNWIFIMFVIFVIVVILLLILIFMTCFIFIILMIVMICRI